jgi:hypothetical protein
LYGYGLGWQYARTYQFDADLDRYSSNVWVVQEAPLAGFALLKYFVPQSNQCPTLQRGG